MVVYVYNKGFFCFISTKGNHLLCRWERKSL